MDGHAPPPDMPALLADARWLRALARRLVSDPAQADDDAQEAWVRALRRPPTASGSLRGWWSTVLRNVVRERVRKDMARARREARVAGRLAQAETTDAAVARAELHRRLVDHVLALEDPYRQVVIWRYFDGHRAADIARLVGVPSGTVRSQLHRAHEKLRQSLDSESGGTRTKWQRAMTPLAGVPAPGWGAGGLVMTTGAKVALGAAAVALLAWGMGRLRSPQSDGAARTPSASQELSTLRDADPRLVAAASPARTASGTQADEGGAAPDREAGVGGPFRIAGSVRDSATGDPLAEARVALTCWRGGVREVLARGRTDKEGNFRYDVSALKERPRFVLSTSTLAVEVCKVGYHPRHHTVPNPPDDEPHVWPSTSVSLTRGRVVRGRVVDRRGDPVAGADVVCAAAAAVGHPPASWAATRADGRFDLAVSAQAVFVRARKEGVGASAFHSVAGGTADVTLTDVRLVGSGVIQGRVVYPSDQPAAYAQVSAKAVAVGGEVGLQRAVTRSDEAGAFVLRGLAPGTYEILPSASTGRPADQTWRTGAADARVVVRSPRVILTVQDEAGNALPGAGYAARWVDPTRTRDAEVRREAGNIMAPDAIHALMAPHGHRLELNVWAGGARLEERVVSMDPSTWEVREDIVLGASGSAVGGVEIRMTDSAGPPIAKARVSIYTALTGALVRYRDPLPNSRRFDGMEPGAYDVEIFPGEGDRPDGMWFPIRKRFQVIEGEDTALDLVARACARIRLEVDVSAGGSAPVSLRQLQAQAVIDDDTPPVRLGSFLTNRDGGGWRQGGIEPGVPGLAHHRFEPGHVTLVLTHPRFAPLRKPVRLEAGRITDVAVTLRPRAE